MYSLAPVVGGLGLYYTQMLLPNASLLQHFSATLFFMGAFVRPFLYLSGLVKDAFLLEVQIYITDSLKILVALVSSSFFCSFIF
jgi:hypothetical protein